MINNFDNYIELEDSYKFSMEIANIYKNRIEKLEQKYSRTAISYGYYTYAKQRWYSIYEEARKLNYLRNEILVNQKTNREMLEIILHYANNHQCHRNQKYNIRIVQDVAKKDIFGIITDDYKWEKVGNGNINYLVLLVKSTISDDEITNILNDTEIYEKYIKEGDIILIDKVYTKLNNQKNINAYLEKNTINVDKIRGINKVTDEFIREKLFEDYKANYYKNRVQTVYKDKKPKTKTKSKKEEH